jgi:hypothetical protein
MVQAFSGKRMAAAAAVWRLERRSLVEAFVTELYLTGSGNEFPAEMADRGEQKIGKRFQRIGEHMTL